jgi:DNA polymerase-3 subunit epsilon
VVFDTETTGLSRETDQIVQFHATKIRKDGKKESLSYLIKPTIKIPPEASKVHGITNEKVAKEKGFSYYAKTINDFMSGSYVAGYNINTFDLPILERQLKEAGIKEPLKNTQAYDAFIVYKKHATRKLADAVFFYTGQDIKDAHSADGDVASTVAVIAKQLEREDKSVGQVINEEKEEEAKREYIIDVSGVRTLNFGKYKGTAIAKLDKGFINWVLNKDFPEEVKNELREFVN